MKILKRSIAVVAVASFVFTLSSCKKYEEGGAIRKAEKNLTAQEWKFSEYLRNGNDETSQVTFSNLTEKYQEGGTLLRNFTDEDNELEDQTGTWEFADKKEKLNISGIGSMEITDETGTVTSSSYEVLKLTKDEFWYSFRNGGDNHEFHFSAN